MTSPPLLLAKSCEVMLIIASALWLLTVLSEPVMGEQTPASETTQTPVSAQVWAVQQSELCSSAIENAEQKYQLPRGLLGAIAKAESGRQITTSDDVRPWPWTIDADGKDLFLDSKAAAVAWVQQQGARHDSIDAGCLQVNLRLHSNRFASVDEAFDPTANVDFAAHYLRDLQRDEAGGSWDLAVGLYHSHTRMLAAEYRDRVAMIGARILRGVLEPVPLNVRVIRQGTVRLALGSGRVARINVNRQPATRSHRRLAPCQIVRLLGNYINDPSGSGGCKEASR
jgi:hypothetical protein